MSSQNYSLDEDASHEKVDIGSASYRNRPAKHVAEEQYEHNWLDRREYKLFWNAWDLNEMAFGQHKGICKSPVERWTRLWRQSLI